MPTELKTKLIVVAMMMFVSGCCGTSAVTSCGVDQYHPTEEEVMSMPVGVARWMLETNEKLEACK